MWASSVQCWNALSLLLLLLHFFASYSSFDSDRSTVASTAKKSPNDPTWPTRRILQTLSCQRRFSGSSDPRSCQGLLRIHPLTSGVPSCASAKFLRFRFTNIKMQSRHSISPFCCSLRKSLSCLSVVRLPPPPVWNTPGVWELPTILQRHNGWLVHIRRKTAKWIGEGLSWDNNNRYQLMTSSHTHWQRMTSLDSDTFSWFRVTGQLLCARKHCTQLRVQPIISLYFLLFFVLVRRGSVMMRRMPKKIHPQSRFVCRPMFPHLMQPKPWGTDV